MGTNNESLIQEKNYCGVKNNWVSEEQFFKLFDKLVNFIRVKYP